MRKKYDFNRTTKNKLYKRLDRLPPREKMILEHVYGLNREELNYEQIGTLLGISRERIRQLHDGALRRIRYWDHCDETDEKLSELNQELTT